MKKVTKSIINLSVISLCFALAACSKNDSDGTAPEPMAADVAEPGLAMSEPSGKPLKLHIGIDTCDAFLDKYRSCYDRLPKNLQASMKNGLEKTQIAWVKEAKNPESHEKIRASCLALDEATAKSMRSQGCKW